MVRFEFCVILTKLWRSLNGMSLNTLEGRIDQVVDDRIEAYEKEEPDAMPNDGMVALLAFLGSFLFNNLIPIISLRSLLLRISLPAHAIWKNLRRFAGIICNFLYLLNRNC